MVRAERKRRAPISRFVSPSATSLADRQLLRRQLIDRRWIAAPGSLAGRAQLALGTRRPRLGADALERLEGAPERRARVDAAPGASQGLAIRELGPGALERPSGRPAVRSRARSSDRPSLPPSGPAHAPAGPRPRRACIAPTPAARAARALPGHRLRDRGGSRPRRRRSTGSPPGPDARCGRVRPSRPRSGPARTRAARWRARRSRLPDRGRGRRRARPPRRRRSRSAPRRRAPPRPGRPGRDSRRGRSSGPIHAPGARLRPRLPRRWRNGRRRSRSPCAAGG